jgi:hypothetical protein
MQLYLFFPRDQKPGTEAKIDINKIFPAEGKTKPDSYQVDRPANQGDYGNENCAMVAKWKKNLRQKSDKSDIYS